MAEPDGDCTVSRQIRFGLLGSGLACLMVPWWIDGALAGRWALGLVLVPWLLPTRRPRLGLGLALALVWLGASGLALVWSPDLSMGLARLWPIALCVACWAVGQEAEERELEVFWLCASVGLGLQLLLQVWQIGASSPGAYFPPAGGFFNKNSLGEAALLALVATWRWPWWGFTAGPLGLVLALTGARECLLGLGLVTGVWAWKRGVVSFLGFLLIAGLALALANPDTLAVRWEIWHGILLHLDWTGHGLDSLRALWPAWGHELSDNSRPEMAHNFLIGSLNDLGFLAIFAIAPWAWAIAQGRETALLAALGPLALGWGPLDLPFCCVALGLLAGSASRAGTGVGLEHNHRGDHLRAGLEGRRAGAGAGATPAGRKARAVDPSAGQWAKRLGAFRWSWRESRLSS